MSPGVRGIKSIVDEACRLNEEVRAKSNRLNLLKDEIKRHARETGIRGIKGNSGYAVVTKHSTAWINPRRVYNALDKKISVFMSVVSVVQKDLLSYLTKEKINSLKVLDTQEYGRVHLRKGKAEDMQRLLRKLDV